jgi:cell division protein FtsB
MTPPAAVPRATRLTSRAAVLAVVICAIALSLAYPVREYVAQRRQIDELVAEQQMMQAQVKHLVADRDMLENPAYIEQIAEQELHMCLPDAHCYVIENGQSVIGLPKTTQTESAPWYSTLWHSVEQSDATASATGSVTDTAPATGSAVSGSPATPAASSKAASSKAASSKAGTSKAGSSKVGSPKVSSTASAGSGTR